MIEIPERLKNRPLYRDLPVPFVAASSDDADGQEGGVVSFKRDDSKRWALCVERKLCAMCGEKLDYWIAFIGGEDSVEQRRFQDPPMHVECAEYALAVCPFFNGDFAGQVVTSDEDDKEGMVQSRGASGKVALYVTRSYEVKREVQARAPNAPGGSVKVLLWVKPAPAKRLEWFVDGEPADG